MTVRLARNEVLETGGGTEVSNEEIGIGARRPGFGQPGGVK
jgi:hypothetical protein